MTAPPWTPEDDALVLAGTRAGLAELLCRTPSAVKQRRCHLLKLARQGRAPLYLPSGGRRRPEHPPAAPGEKWCPACGDSRPLSEFHVRRASRDGRQALCKVHQAQRQRDDSMG